MAKYETRLRGDFDETLRYLHDGILDKSASASYECAAASVCMSGTAGREATACP